MSSFLSSSMCLCVDSCSALTSVFIGTLILTRSFLLQDKIILKLLPTLSVFLRRSTYSQQFRQVVLILARDMCSPCLIKIQTSDVDINVYLSQLLTRRQFCEKDLTKNLLLLKLLTFYIGGRVSGRS